MICLQETKVHLKEKVSKENIQKSEQTMYESRKPINSSTSLGNEEINSRESKIVKKTKIRKYPYLLHTKDEN